MISVQNLTKSYGELMVLKDVSVEINKGDVISIIGSSGCGKSTFIRCLNRLEEVSSGHVFIDGVDITDDKNNVPKIRQKMGMVFQNFNLYAHLTVIENIMLAPMKLQKISKQEAYDRAIELLTTVGLQSKALAFPDELSGGQKQRVAIARTLAMQPEIILFDEPTSALDPTMVNEVLYFIRMLVKPGVTMVIVTHEIELATDTLNRVFSLYRTVIY